MREGATVVDVPRVATEVLVPVASRTVDVVTDKPAQPLAGAGMTSPLWPPWPFKPFLSTVICTNRPGAVA